MNQQQTTENKQDQKFHSPPRQAQETEHVYKQDHPFLQAQGIIGNHGVLQCCGIPVIQTKLKISQPEDVYEQEADRVADEVMRMPYPVNHKKEPLTNHSYSGSSQNIPLLVNEVLQASGKPLDTDLCKFMEPRFGFDFSKVRIHAGGKATESATSIDALAYTIGNDIVFRSEQYYNHSSSRDKLIAHELVHVIQQRGINNSNSTTKSHENLLAIKQASDNSIIARLSVLDCSKNCTKEDGKSVATGKFTITIYADKEGSFLLLPATQKVGHSWLRLENDQGQYWTFGFWPQDGYDPNNIRSDVNGCVHHPDISHTPTASQTFELTPNQFSAAFRSAVNICRNRPKYNLFGLQCTEFVKRVLTSAGKSSFGGFGLIWESPNALNTWMQTHSLIAATSTAVATSAKGKMGVGSFAFDLTYRNQFYSLLGKKLRLYGLGRTEISRSVKSLSGGLGIELNPQKVWLPVAFLEGGGNLGDLNPIEGKSHFGAGVSGSAGFRFNLDELIVIGIEYNVVKDIVNSDSLLQRLMISAGFKLF